jgi:hypothetical protein
MQTHKATDPLEGMTSDKWDRMSPAQRASVRSDKGLTPQLVGLEGKRVEVVTSYDETRRFWVGKSTGWVPCHLEILKSNSMGGSPAEKAYKSVRIVDHGPRR